MYLLKLIKCSALCDMSAKTLRNIHLRTFILVYCAPIRSHLEYAYGIWDPQFKSTQNSILNKFLGALNYTMIGACKISK